MRAVNLLPDRSGRASRGRRPAGSKKPLAILGAIYTAYFMSPKMRGWVKPAIEMMAALPTVILGFLAGLWLAPMIDSHLSPPA